MIGKSRMGMKIAFVYLDVSNLGDLVIFETARYIVEDILKKNKMDDYEIAPIDIGSYKNKKINFRKRVIRRVLTDLLRHMAGNRICAACFPGFSKKAMRALWHLTPPYANYLENEKPKLKGADAIIFGGGGLIKFHRQNFHFFIDDITHYAEEENIPVLFNAQGMEGYNEANLGCQLLKAALNRDCVKYISTRDDFDMLHRCYVKNPQIEARSVCDPAFWVPETYHIQNEGALSKKVGLNVIRTNIFGEDMNSGIDRSSFGELYHGLIGKLFWAGYAVELFSNGEEHDTAFMEWLLERYPDLQRDFHVTAVKPASTKEFVSLLSGYERFMAVRLHSAIIGAVLGVPNISLVWNRKQILFGEKIGMAQNFLSKEQFTADEVFKCLFAARPYKMDEGYKMSVYQNMENQLKTWVISEEKGKTQ